MDNKIKLLIVDDYETNRMVLKSICRKMEEFEIREAQNGLEAVALSEEWTPHIIMMDIMMPELDGFEASKIIKSRFPDTIIMVITAASDKKLEENFAAIGVSTYIHKPVDKELIRFKLNSFAALLRSKEGKHLSRSNLKALNPFSSDVRHFKTVFEITDPDAMMDFGMWILMRCESTKGTSYPKVDMAIELFYELMSHKVTHEEVLKIVVEENFDEIFVTLPAPVLSDTRPKIGELIHELGDVCIVREQELFIRLDMNYQNNVTCRVEPVNNPKPVMEVSIEPQIESTPSIIEKTLVASEPESEKEKRVLPSEEQTLLRQSFTNKTSAVDYINDIGGDVLDEIRDLASLDDAWKDELRNIEIDPSIESLYNFVDNVLGHYTHAINSLFEFTALAYALSALGVSIKEHAQTIVEDSASLPKIVMLLEHLGHDLASWREHIFQLQDTADIHYLDSSFFSSCIQIEGIISNKEIEADDDNDLELF